MAKRPSNHSLSNSCLAPAKIQVESSLAMACLGWDSVPFPSPAWQAQAAAGTLCARVMVPGVCLWDVVCPSRKLFLSHGTRRLLWKKPVRASFGLKNVHVLCWLPYDTVHWASGEVLIWVPMSVCSPFPTDSAASPAVLALFVNVGPGVRISASLWHFLSSLLPSACDEHQIFFPLSLPAVSAWRALSFYWFLNLAFQPVFYSVLDLF